MTRAIFITRQAAYHAIIQHAKAKGVDSTTVITRGRAQRVYRRGELIGYHASYPVTEEKNSYVMEA